MRKSKSVRTKYATQHDASQAEVDARDEKEDETKQGDGGGTHDAQGYFVEKNKRDELREELKESEADLAIVCPLVDGRLKDLAAK
jgi:hypothetical protein